MSDDREQIGWVLHEWVDAMDHYSYRLIDKNNNGRCWVQRQLEITEGKNAGLYWEFGMYPGPVNDEFARLASQLAERDRELETAKERIGKLATYTGHRASCAYDPPVKYGPCDCGLAALLEDR